MNDDELRSNIETLLTSDTTYLIPPGVDETQWYLDHIMGLVKASKDVSGVTRLEIMDSTTCKTCKGKKFVLIEGNDKPTECPVCHGLGCPGRGVVFWESKKTIELSLQDEARTLKIFINERGE